MKVDNSSIYDASRFKNDSLFERLGYSSREEAIAKIKNQRDTFELKGMEKWNGCEQYNDLGKQLVKSGNVGLSISSDVRTDMRLTLEDYYAGNYLMKSWKNLSSLIVLSLVFVTKRRYWMYMRIL